jgi:hypothetical protein
MPESDDVSLTESTEVGCVVSEQEVIVDIMVVCVIVEVGPGQTQVCPSLFWFPGQSDGLPALQYE